MKKMAHISSGKVVNISVWDGSNSWAPTPDVVEIPSSLGVAIGWEYVGGQFIEPQQESSENN